MTILTILLSTLLMASPQHKKVKHKHKHHVKHHVRHHKSHPKHDIVTATTYKVNEYKNDPFGAVTATGLKLSAENSRQHKVIAVSRDLIKKYKFGQHVKITGAGEYDGDYFVLDLMNKRWKKKIDILVNAQDTQSKFFKVKIEKI